jgi:hypothetical protein
MPPKLTRARRLAGARNVAKVATSAKKISTESVVVRINRKL